MSFQLRRNAVPLTAPVLANGTKDIAINKDEGLTDDATELVPDSQLESGTANLGTAVRSNRSGSSKTPDSPLFLSDGDIHSPRSTRSSSKEKQGRSNDGFVILIPPVTRRWEYRLYNEDATLKEILDEYEDSDELRYQVKYRSGRQAEVSSSWLFIRSFAVSNTLFPIHHKHKRPRSTITQF